MKKLTVKKALQETDVTSENTGKPSLPAPIRIPEAAYNFERYDPATRFWSKVAKAGPDECWLWTGMKRKGYGWMKLNNGMLKAGECVRHKCDNPSCVNPAHLLRGSRVDNRRDCTERNRQAKGVTNGNALLTPEAVKDIKANYVYRKTPLRVFAERYGVKIGAIAGVVYGKTWRDV